MDALLRLRQSHLFAELSDDEMSALAGIVSFRRFAGGQTLFREHDPAAGFFILVSGSVRIYKSSAEGKEYTLHQIAPGQMFAEAAIFRGGDYPAHCMANQDSEVAYLPKVEFLALLQSYPKIALKIMSGLSAWLREFTQKLQALSLLEVPARLAAYLLQQSVQAGGTRFRLPTSKTQLASELGTISETLSRSLRKLKDAGLIHEEGRTVSILDPERLRALAEGEKISQ